ncbi:type I-E CRISPR-associated protein Cse2/CasB [Actinotignum urinale]|uniref:Type I-E CRISPR-associated protein Cse2/CasB n=1 Tax=Actinotignum urinale TaxID=190146 RepID=A0AAW9HZV0_9ACTO|nr:type I-E CRISPR-associated protein Cse2/CasB [Actinotignum urinale]MDY5155554.1 type I-E CRISPR-associated protein Cse2/CasB [Actinotignum urinale]
MEKTISTHAVSTKYESPVMRAVNQAISRLRRQLSEDGGKAESHARAVLSRLRHAAGIDPEENLLAWSTVMGEVVPDLPEKLLGKGDAPSPSEYAIFTALTLYGLHQQSVSENMHSPESKRGQGMSFACSVGKMAQQRGSASIKGRFDALMTAKTRRSRGYYLRNIVGLLRTEKIPCDYGRLAEDLRRIENPAQRSRVLLAWGRDYARGFYPTSRDVQNSEKPAEA